MRNDWVYKYIGIGKTSDPKNRSIHIKDGKNIYVISVYNGYPCIGYDKTAENAEEIREELVNIFIENYYWFKNYDNSDRFNKEWYDSNHKYGDGHLIFDENIWRISTLQTLYLELTERHRITSKQYEYLKANILDDYYKHKDDYKKSFFDVKEFYNIKNCIL